MHTGQRWEKLNVLPEDDLGNEYYDFIHDEIMAELELMGDDPETMQALRKLWEE